MINTNSDYVRKIVADHVPQRFQSFLSERNVRVLEGDSAPQDFSKLSPLVRARNARWISFVEKNPSVLDNLGALELISVLAGSTKEGPENGKFGDRIFGLYMPEENTVYVEKEATPFVILHELGHAFDFNYLPQQPLTPSMNMQTTVTASQRIIKDHPLKDLAVLKGHIHSPRETFADWFAMYCGINIANVEKDDNARMIASESDPEMRARFIEISKTLDTAPLRTTLPVLAKNFFDRVLA